MKSLFRLVPIIILLAVLSCSSKGIELKEYSKITFNKKEMTEIDVKYLRKALVKLQPTQHQFETKPEITLLCYDSPEDESPDMISVFWSEGFLYEGDDFNAIANNMRGRKTDCYKISDEVEEILSFYLD